MKASIRSRFPEQLLDARRNRRVHRKQTRPWWHRRHFPRCDLIACSTCQPWQGRSSNALTALGLWLLAHDWFERLAPFAPRLRGPLAAHVADALNESVLSTLPDLPFVPVVQLDVQAEDLRALLHRLDAEPSAIERARERGRTTIFVEGFVPVELWLRAGPHDELPFLGSAATPAEIARLVARFCPP